MVERFQTDVLIIGAGVAGMAAALEAHRAGAEVELAWAGGGASTLAQGGMAAAVGKDDCPAAHAADTLAAGAGLSQPEVVNSIVSKGAGAVQWLSAQGVEWDREANGSLALAMEAAHSRPRVAHAGGDRSGHAITQALRQRLIDVKLHPNASLEGLLVDEAGVAGAQLHSDNELLEVRAGSTILAVGGYAGLYQRTATSPNCNGAALALAAHAGAELADLELVQFHPTVYSGSGDPFLITEALRGAGARLIDQEGRCFLGDYDPRGELAPRGVVSRAILDHLMRSAQGATSVGLDVRHLDPELLARDFGGFLGCCHRQGLDPTRQIIPVAPAAHYTMGGMVTDLWGRTIIPGLLGTGECARIGLHGANRLASNSLLEAVVMGRRAGQVTTSPSRTQPISNYRVVKLRGEGEMRIEQLRRVISQAAGPTRRANTLRQAQAELASDRGASPSVEATRQLASWIIEAALTREESRGGHYRIDYPESDPRWREREIVIRNLTQTVDARQLPVEASVV